MRLRYVRIQKSPPLMDVPLVFEQEDIFGDQCAIHFLVGINGTGKTRFLCRLMDVFLALERNGMPEFPATLVYDLGREPEMTTVVFDFPGGSWSNGLLLEYRSGTCAHYGLKSPNDTASQAALPRSAPDLLLLDDIEWSSFIESVRTGERLRATPKNRYVGNNLPGTGSIRRLLPGSVLVYTSGIAKPWIDVFEKRIREEGAIEDFAMEDTSRERPPDWNATRELGRSDSEVTDKEDEESSSSSSSDDADTEKSLLGVFVSPNDLKLAAYVVSIAHAFREWEDKGITSPTDAKVDLFIRSLGDDPDSEGDPLRPILQSIDWLWPLTLGLHFDYHAEEIDPEQEDLLTQLGTFASAAHKDPVDGPGRHFYFDLLTKPTLSEAVRKKCEAYPILLSQFLRREPCELLDVFLKLSKWRRTGFLKAADLVVWKSCPRKVLLYDQLSDGECEFLGRMSLFHLLESRAGVGAHDTLTILDEPETHFNDMWKRELVAMIADVVGKRPSQVLISTHSSIALTDVFETEIAVLEKDRSEGGSIRASGPINGRTFGATPDQTMREVFGATDTVGRRASRLIDVALAAASQADAVEALWRDWESLDKAADQRIDALWSTVEREIRGTRPEFRTLAKREHLVRVLDALKHLADNSTVQEERPVFRALEALGDRLGPGYYEFGVLRKLDALRRPSTHAASD